MATNKKKVLVPDTMGRAGLNLLHAREDVEVATFPNFIGRADFQALLRQHGVVNGVILGAVMVDYIHAGETLFLTGWLLPHGAIEIPAIAPHLLNLRCDGRIVATSTIRNA